MARPPQPGGPSDMVRILTDASVPGWARILAEGGTFTWETWTPSDLVGDSLSHGWGSSALVAMQETLLGVSLTVPAHASALVHLPASGPSQVREGGVAAGRSPGVCVSSVADGVAVLSVGSGGYRFTSG